MESNTLKKSLNNSVAFRIFVSTPLMIQQIVRIYDVGDFSWFWVENDWEDKYYKP